MVPIRPALSLLLILALDSANLRADPVPVSPAEQAWQEAAFSAVQQATRTFRADLSQAILVRPLFHTFANQGEIFYQAPDRLLVRLTRPPAWLRIAHGQVTLQKADAPPKQTPLDSADGANAAALLDFFRSDSARWHRDFSVSITRDGDLLRFKLVPLPGCAKRVESIVTTLRLPRYDILAMDISVNPLIHVSYQFSESRRNAPLDPAVFAHP